MKREALSNWAIIAALCISAASDAWARNIVVNGEFSDWALVNPITKDKAEGEGPCDWREVYATHDQEHWYIRYVCEEDIDLNIGGAYNIFVDVDRNRMTGYRGAGDEFSVGAEYLIQGSRLFSYAGGDGISWQWEQKADLKYEAVGECAELAVPRSQLDNADRIHFFLYGDNFAIRGNPCDICPDSALKVSGSGAALRYSFRSSD